MPKVFVSGGGGCYGPHKAYGVECTNFSEFRDHPEQFSMLVIPGGADVDPSLYGHQQHPQTSMSSRQDAMDVAAYNVAQAHGIPCVGICRGGQFLIAMAGGFLFQHVTNHGQTHLATTFEGANFEVTSCHHQMFGMPLPEKAQLLAWSTVRRSRCYEVGYGEGFAPPVEPECVYLPTINAIATQWHPEWMEHTSPGRQFHEFVVEKHLKSLAVKRFK